MASVRKSRFWFDNSSGTITEYTAQVNDFSWPQEREILDDTGLNENDRQYVGGIRANTVSVNGRVDSTISLYEALRAASQTSVTKTVYALIGDVWHYGESLVGSFTPSADGKALQTFAATLTIDGAVSTTSVAPS